VEGFKGREEKKYPYDLFFFAKKGGKTAYTLKMMETLSSEGIAFDRPPTEKEEAKKKNWENGKGGEGPIKETTRLNQDWAL